MVEIESIRVLGSDSDDLTHDLLTVKQGATYYGCSIENIHKMIQASTLDCFIDQDNINYSLCLEVTSFGNEEDSEREIECCGLVLLVLRR